MPGPTTFLDLPEELRDRIYHEAGAISGGSVRLRSKAVIQNSRDEWPPHCPNTYLDSFCARGKDGLLVYYTTLKHHSQAQKTASMFQLSLSHSRIRTDVTRFLYAHMEVLICCEDYQDLEILLHPQFRWLASIRRLTIHLSPTGVHQLPEGLCSHRAYDRTQETLKSTSNPYKALIRRWSELVERLVHLNTNNAWNLDLKVLCDVDYLSTAHQVVQPLIHYQVPVSTLRLGSSLDRSLTTVARETMLFGVKRLPNQAFPFVKLPTEIRHHILSYTDLVTPDREIHWHDDGGFGKFSHARCEWSFNHSMFDCDEFCALRSAVYPHCEAWEPPSALFIVCKEMLDDVRAVYFSSNRFIIDLDFRRPGWNFSFWGSRFDFLRKFAPTEALSHLRSLEIRFPKTHYDFSGADEEAYRFWIKSIDYLSSRVKRLNLRLYMTHTPVKSTDQDAILNWYGDEYKPEDTKPIEQLESLFKVQAQIVRPLSRLPNLDNCFVRAMTPWQVQRDPEPAATEERRRAQESYLEKLVMGIGYDGIAKGKLEQRESDWMKKYEGNMWDL